MGNITVKSGTTRTGLKLHTHDELYVYGTANSTVIQEILTNMFVSEGGVANDTALLTSFCHMSIGRGGRANRTSAEGPATIYISSGGTATDTWLTNVAILEIRNGGKAYNTVAGKGSGCVYVSSGGYASGIEAKGEGRIRVSSGGTAESIVLNEMGSLFVSSAGFASGVTVNSWGHVFVSSAGFASGVTVNSRGYVEVYSDGMANGVTVNAWGSVCVSSGGRVQDITLSSGGTLTVHSGGRANDITWTPFLTTLEISSGATVTYSDKMRGVYYGSGIHLISSAAASMSGTVIGSRYVMHVMNSAGVDNITIESDGFLHISSGATADNITVEIGGALHISGGTGNNISAYGEIKVKSGAVANSVSLYSSDTKHGFMVVSSGGVANHVLLNNLTWLYVSSGGTASVAFNPFCQADVVSGEGATVTCLERDANVYCGWWGKLISSAGTMHDLTMVHRSAYVYSGGGIYRATLSNAMIDVSEGGRVDSVTLDSGGFLYISSGGSANDTVVNNSKGVFAVYSGGIASRTTVKNGMLDVHQDGMATGVVVSSGGSFGHSGTASSVTVYAGGHLSIVNENAVANGVTVSSRGSADVYRGTANGVTVSSGGTMTARVSGRVTGKMTFASNAVVSVYSGGVIDFDLTQTSAGASALLNDLSAVKGAPVYTITVDGTQNNGIYNLAAGASGFGSKKEVSVRNTFGTELGTLTVNDAEEYVSLGGKRYLLKLNGANLYVTVADDAPGGNVITGAVTGTTIISSGMTALGVDVNNGGWLNLKKDGTASNTTVNSGGLFYVSKGGDLRGVTVVNGGGSVFVTSDAVARDMILDGGVMVVESDAVAFRTSKGSNVATNTIVKNGGRLGVIDGGRVWGAHISSGGLATIWNGGEISGATVDKGELHAKVGASVRAVGLRNGGVMYVSSGVSAYGINISSGGTMSVESGAILERINLSSGGILTGVLRGAHMISCYGGTADLNIANTAPDGEFLFDEETFLDSSEELYCTLTVSDAQAEGTYNLMGNAYGFNKTVTVQNTSGEELGTLTVGETVDINGMNYTLNLGDSPDYSLTVRLGEVDLTAPTITNIAPDIPGWTNQSVTVTADFADNKKLASRLYRIDDGAWTDYVDGVTVDENVTITFRAVDTSGNETEAVYDVTNIDKEKPELIGISIDPMTPARYVTVNASFTDNVGVNKIYFKTNDGNWYSPKDGKTTVDYPTSIVYAKAVDSAGNESEVVSCPVKIGITGDMTDPDYNLIHHNMLALDVNINDGYTLYVLSGGVASNTTVNSGGSLHLQNGGTAVNTTVNPNGYLRITGNGVADVVMIHSGGSASVAENGVANSVTVGESAYLHVLATANDVSTDDGLVCIYSGGNVVNAAIGPKGHFVISSDGTVTGKMSFANGAVVSAHEGSIIGFDISGLAPDNAALVNYLSVIRGTPLYTLTVDGSQANGTYKLATGAAGFNKTITVVNTEETSLGTLTVGQTTSIGGVDYTLNLGDDVLSVTVGSAVQTKPAKFDVDGNGVSDVMFVWTGYNYAHGYWMNGDANDWRSTYAVHPAEWENLGCHDMNGDGKADSVLVGNIELEAGKGTYIGYYLNAEDTDANWVNIDFLNNEAEVVWKNKVCNLTGNANANSIIWYAPDMYTVGAWLDGTSQWALLNGNFGGDFWQMVGCGDFDGDGKDSVLMSGGNGQMLYSVGLDGVATSHGSLNWSGWDIRAIGDFAGDGRDDIVLFHGTLGAMALLVDGNTDDYVSLGQLDPADWFVVGAGDYNGDQKDDLLVRQKTTGMLGYYNACDVATGWVEMGRGVDLNWTVIA